MNTEKAFSFLIVAGGSGSRIGGQGKQFRLLGAKPLWRWSVDLAASPRLRNAGIREIVLVLPEGCELEREESGASAAVPIIVWGGAARPDSVRNGLAACRCDYVMIHDAARPFASETLLLDLMRNTDEATGAVPVMPIAEAVKRIDGTGNVQAVNREGLFATQTPQSFHRATLERVMKEGGAKTSLFKDEAEAWLGAGLPLRCVDGERLNFKVTWTEDLMLASALASQEERERRGSGEMRTGIGYDVHRLVPERPLVLGGVDIDSPLGLLGHSDADIVAHTVADALLGAAGLPDIGNLFPASDEKYRNADSMELLRQTVDLVKRERWDIVWVDSIIEAQIPRLNDYLPDIRRKVSAVLTSENVPCFNIKAKSAEKTGDAGMGRSIVCRAVATLSEKRTSPGTSLQ